MLASCLVGWLLISYGDTGMMGFGELGCSSRILHSILLGVPVVGIHASDEAHLGHLSEAVITKFCIRKLLFSSISIFNCLETNHYESLYINFVS